VTSSFIAFFPSGQARKAIGIRHLTDLQSGPMSDAWRVASIKSFEQVPVAASSGLLRVSAQSAFRSRPDDLRPTLVADDGSTVLRFAAIPAPGDSGGMLRAAYSVPADVATPETVFSLEFEDGFVIALPNPTPGQSRISRRVTPAPAPAPVESEPPEPTVAAADAPAEPPPGDTGTAGTPPADTAAVDITAPESVSPEPTVAAAATAAEAAPDGEERRSEPQSKLTELTEELAEARRQLAELRDDADFGARARDSVLGMLSGAALAHAELQASRDLDLHAAGGDPGVDIARAELERRVTEAEQRHADAEAEHAETRGRLTDTEQQLDEATRRADTAARELAGERDRIGGLEDRAAALEAEAQELRDRTATAEHERDEAEETRRQAEATVEPLQAAKTRAERELVELQDQVHKMGLERDELGRQAQAFDGVAVKARERAAEAEAELQRTRGRLDELEIWTAELERRLAEATTQLAEARLAAPTDEGQRQPAVGLDDPSPPSPSPSSEGGPAHDIPTAVPDIPDTAGPSALPRESAAARAVRAMGQTSRTVSDSQLDEIRRAALSEATAQAERDLQDASAGGRF
jgi:hypothetical protein